MKQVFISYSSADRTIARAIHAHLTLTHDVFLDREGLHAGLHWEQQLQASLSQADAVLALVSETSVASTWVARELSFAERLGKPCIPALLSGQLPLRLSHLQYVDFRGAFEPAMTELLDAIGKVAQPSARSRHTATVLLGSALRARLAGDLVTADALVRRAAEADPDVAPLVQGLWQRAATASRPRPEASTFRAVDITERTRALPDSPYAQRDAYVWSVSLAGPAALLDAVDHVEYELHPTFKPARQIVRARDEGFLLKMVGWGRFEVLLRLHLVDGKALEGAYMLTFAPELTSSVPVRAL